MRNALKHLTWVRGLQVGIGTFAVVDYIFYSGAPVGLLLGMVLLGQGLFNLQLGCMSGSCKVDPTKSVPSEKARTESNATVE